MHDVLDADCKWQFVYDVGGHFALFFNHRLISQHTFTCSPFSENLILNQTVTKIVMTKTITQLSIGFGTKSTLGHSC